MSGSCFIIILHKIMIKSDLSSRQGTNCSISLYVMKYTLCNAALQLWTFNPLFAEHLCALITKVCGRLQ